MRKRHHLRVVFFTEQKIVTLEEGNENEKIQEEFSNSHGYFFPFCHGGL